MHHNKCDAFDLASNEQQRFIFQSDDDLIQRSKKLRNGIFCMF